MSRQSINYTTASQDGTVEFPSNSNKTTYGKWYGLDGVKWYCIFVSWVYDHASHHRGKVDTAHGYRSCQSGMFSGSAMAASLKIRSGAYHFMQLER